MVSILLNTKGRNSINNVHGFTILVFSYHLIILNICIKFRENTLSSFRVMERTPFVTDRHTERQTDRQLCKTQYFSPLVGRQNYSKLTTIRNEKSWTDHRALSKIGLLANTDGSRNITSGKIF